MTQTQLTWFIKVQIRLLKKRFYLYKISDKLSSRKYELTSIDFENAGDALEKILKIINTCKFSEQIENTENIIDTFSLRFPFALIVQKILYHKLEKKRKDVRSYYFEPDSFEDEGYIPYVPDDYITIQKRMNDIK